MSVVWLSFYLNQGMQGKKQQLELDMEQQTGSKLWTKAWF